MRFWKDMDERTNITGSEILMIGDISAPNNPKYANWNNLKQGLEDKITRNVHERRFLLAENLLTAVFGYYYIDLRNADNANIAGLPTGQYNIAVISEDQKNATNTTSQIAIDLRYQKMFFRTITSRTQASPWKEVTTTADILQGLGSATDKVMSQDAVTKNIPERKRLSAAQIASAPFGFYYTDLRGGNDADIVGLPADTYNINVISHHEKLASSTEEYQASQIAIGRNTHRIFFRIIRGRAEFTTAWIAITTTADILQGLGSATNKVMSQDAVAKNIPERRFLNNPSELNTFLPFGFYSTNIVTGIGTDVGLPNGIYNILIVGTNDKNANLNNALFAQIAIGNVFANEVEQRIFFRTRFNGAFSVWQEIGGDVLRMSDIVQVVGDKTDKVMSQDAVTRRFNNIRQVGGIEIESIEELNETEAPNLYGVSLPSVHPELGSSQFSLIVSDRDGGNSCTQMAIVFKGDELGHGIFIRSGHFGNWTPFIEIGGFIPLSEKGQPNGVATLNNDGTVPASQLPTNSILSSTDRAKLNGIQAGAQVNEVTAAQHSALSLRVNGTTLSESTSTTQSAVNLGILLNTSNQVSDTSLRGSAFRYEFEMNEISLSGWVATNVKFTLTFSTNASNGAIQNIRLVCNTDLFYDHWTIWGRNRNFALVRSTNNQLTLCLFNPQNTWSGISGRKQFNILVFRNNNIDNSNRALSLAVNPAIASEIGVSLFSPAPAQIVQNLQSNIDRMNRWDSDWAGGFEVGNPWFFGNARISQMWYGDFHNAVNKSYINISSHYQSADAFSVLVKFDQHLWKAQDSANFRVLGRYDITYSGNVDESKLKITPYIAYDNADTWGIPDPDNPGDVLEEQTYMMIGFKIELLDQNWYDSVANKPEETYKRIEIKFGTNNSMTLDGNQIENGDESFLFSQMSGNNYAIREITEAKVFVDGSLRI